MKKYFSYTTFLLAGIVLFFAQCKKTRVELIGSASTAAFTFLQAPASDTLPYPYKVTFTNNST